MTRAVRVIGAGRAGGSFALALGAIGWDVAPLVSRDSAAIAAAAEGVDLVLICVADAAVTEVAAAVAPDDRCVVAHVAGSLGLAALGTTHRRVASIHPLVSLPDDVTGSARLLAGSWFAIDGDPIVAEVVEALGGTACSVDDEHRVVYHAAACVAANHLVALMGQVERLAVTAGVPIEAYLDLARGALDNVGRLGARAALTGPAARGDEATIATHLAALDPAEHPTYEALAAEARRLAGAAS